MKCVICKHGELKPGITSVLFEKNGTTVVIKSVPADICDNY
jgi:YgiT-type zinc finger domain-containing protein